MNKIHTYLAALALLLLSLPAHAAVPPTTWVEGQLKSAGGSPISDGTYNLTLRLYDQQTAGKLLWQEGPMPVAVAGGLFAVAAGAQVALDGSLFGTGPSIWLSMQVDADPELPRQPLTSVPFALRAQLAEGLACVGCVTAQMLEAGVLAGFARTADLSVYAKLADLVPYAKTTDLAVYATIAQLAAYAKIDDLSVYAKTSALASYATVTQLAAYALTTDLAAYAKTASLATVATTGQYSDLLGIPATTLPADGLSAVSNGLLTNVFTTTTASSNAPIAIKDYYPPGVSDSLTVPDVGVVQSLTVSVNLANSDVAGLTLTLTDPNGGSYVLYDKASTGTSLNKTFPALAGWVGKNAKGAWSLKIVDAAFLNGTTDGQVTSWSVTVQTLSQKQVAATGDFAVKGTLWGGDNGVLNVGGPLQVQGVPVARVWTAQSDALAEGAYVEVATAGADPLVGASGWVNLGGTWANTVQSGTVATTCSICGDGSDLDFIVATASTAVLPAGNYNFRRFEIGRGAKLTVSGATGATIRVAGSALILGWLSADGSSATSDNIGGSGGPGAAKGGDGIFCAACGTAGQGAGAGQGGCFATCNCTSDAAPAGGGAGHAAAGSNGHDGFNSGTGGGPVPGGVGGKAYGDLTLSAGAEAGSGGGGGGWNGALCTKSGGGGGGGGALTLIAAAITVGAGGIISASGGNGYNEGGGGSGGTVWLRAPTLQVLGNISAAGGGGNTGWGGTPPPSGNGHGSAGRIRVDGAPSGTWTSPSDGTSFYAGDTSGLGASAVNNFPITQPAPGTVRLTNNSGATQKVRLVVMR